MIQTRTDQGDAAGFIANVDLLLRGITTTQAPKDLILIRIDNWFGPKWLRFSGKILGAAGFWNETLAVPPFVPNRVVSERRLSAPTYDERPNRQPLHVSVSSERATYRYASLEAQGAALLWFSGNSQANGRGAVMAYVPTRDSYWVGYAGFSESNLWRPTALKGITDKELSALAAL